MNGKVKMGEEALLILVCCSVLQCVAVRDDQVEEGYAHTHVTKGG